MKLMMQSNEKSFELEIKLTDDRILQEQLQNKCSDNKELHAKVTLLEQQLTSLSDDKLSSSTHEISEKASYVKELTSVNVVEFKNLVDKYEGIFTIKLGVHRALVVIHWEIAKECLTINDKAFATRPKLASSKILGYNCAMIAFALYGPYWHQVCKFATIDLLSNHRLELFKLVREFEVKTSLQQLYQLWNKKKSSNCSKVIVEMKRWFRDVTLNVILRIVVGKRIPNPYEGDCTSPIFLGPKPNK
ncbi:hypothetical protein Golob_027924 [Gossypium lobatum]|uniref:Uncharacterized protein n=1 Tax=Gossypium lobatum TaxID=34289 RepID=A0A7J8NIY1_9ROSI|nr:hypothetical protein [Gossypium lobatum]